MKEVPIKLRMGVSLLFFLVVNKKAVRHTSNDLDLRIPEVGAFTKLW